MRRLAVPVALVLLLSACGVEEHSSAGAPVYTTTATPATPPATTAAVTTDTGGGSGAAPTEPAASTTAAPTTTLAPPQGGFGVARHDGVLVDTTRPTAADPARLIAASPQRRLPIVVLYPTDAPLADGVPVPVDQAAATGRFPVVVFSHGVTSSGDQYVLLLQKWVEAGYIVVAPTYPLSSGPGGQVADYPNQPGDVSFVLGQVLDTADQSSLPYAGHIDTDKVAVAGHSLGAITTIGVAYDSCCVDDRIDAAIEISGVQLPFPNGDYNSIPDTPLLLVHGTADSTVPVSGSDNLFETVVGPRAYLRMPDAGHSDVLLNERGDLLTTVVIAFLDKWLKGDDRRLTEVPTAVADSGLATFATRTG